MKNGVLVAVIINGRIVGYVQTEAIARDVERRIAARANAARKAVA